MRQWDGGPKDVGGGPGFWGGAAAGLAEGVAQIGLEEFKTQKQMELAKFEDDLANIRLSKEWERDDKISAQAGKAGLLKEEREAMDAASKLELEYKLKERLEGVKASYDTGKGSGSSKKNTFSREDAWLSAALPHLDESFDVEEVTAMKPQSILAALKQNGSPAAGPLAKLLGQLATTDDPLEMKRMLEEFDAGSDSGGIKKKSFEELVAETLGPNGP